MDSYELNIVLSHKSFDKPLHMGIETASLDRVEP